MRATSAKRRNQDSTDARTNTAVRTNASSEAADIDREQHPGDLQPSSASVRSLEGSEGEARRVAGQILRGRGPPAIRHRHVGNAPQRAPDSSKSTEDERHEDEEEEEEELLQTSPAPSSTTAGTPAAETGRGTSRSGFDGNLLTGGGRPLQDRPRQFFESRFGRSFEDVRVHTDANADAASRELRADAFTRGRDIFFRSGRFDTGSEPGRRLLAHELTHVVQQRSADQPQSQTHQSTPRVSRPDDPLEREARSVATRVAEGADVRTMAFSAATTSIVARQVAGSAPVGSSPADAVQPTSPSGSTSAAPGGAGSASGPTSAQAADDAADGTASEPPVELRGATEFDPPAAVVERLEAARRNKGDVPVRFGTLAAGTLRVRRLPNGTYQTVGTPIQFIPFTHPDLTNLGGVEPMLAVSVTEGVVTGHLTIRGAPRRKKTELTQYIATHPTEMGWLGLDGVKLPPKTNELKDGTLTLMVDDLAYDIGGFVHGTGRFGIVNDTVVFDSTATVNVPKLQEPKFIVSRGEDGSLHGRGEIPVALDKFSGVLIAEYGNGTVDVEGTVRYETEKMQGEVTLLVTDAETARNVALERLGPDALVQSATEAGGSAGGSPAAAGPKPGPRALAGYGTIQVSVTEWLTGQAQVIIDSEGQVTIVGEITPPAEVILFEQRDYVHEFPKLEVRARYGVPVVGNVFVFANVGMAAVAKMGPGKLYNIRLEGTYSTDPRVFQNFSIQGTFNVSAFAGVRVRAEGGAGIEIADHDIKAGVGLNGLAGVRGYVEATPTVGYREVAAPEEGKQGEFFIAGRMDLAAQPFLGLSGDLFVELDSPWWSPAPDKTWDWPLGNLEYPLPGEFGLSADVEHVLGSREAPEIEFGEVDFDSSKFMTDLMNDKVPKGSGGEKETKGTFEDTSGGPSSQPTVEAGAGGTGGTGGGAKPPELASGGASGPSRQPATGQQGPESKSVRAPGKERQWLEGMRALRTLAEQSRRDPLTRPELDAALAGIRRQHAFTTLTVRKVGEDWLVHAAMSPGENITVERESEDTADESAGTEGDTDAHGVSRTEINRRFRHRLDETYVFQVRAGVWTVQRGRGQAQGPAAKPKRRLIHRGSGSYSLENVGGSDTAEAKATHEQILSDNSHWKPYFLGHGTVYIQGHSGEPTQADRVALTEKVRAEDVDYDHSDPDITEPGTGRGFWIPDHQPPRAVGRGGANVDFRFYAHSRTSASKQGGYVNHYARLMKQLRDRGDNDWAVGIQDRWFWEH